MASTSSFSSLKNIGSNSTDSYIFTLKGGQGTWREHLTIPNMLKEFNPNLIGYSLGDSYTYHKESQFNIAEIAAMSQDMPYMAQQLVKRIQNDPRVDMKNDWKV